MDSCTGVAICNAIVEALNGLGLDVQMCRAQTYDGAGNMASSQNGCAKHFQKLSPRAFYFHCASHELNLSLSHVSKVVEIHNMACSLKSIGIFFKYSPKWQRELERSIVKIGERKNSTAEDNNSLEEHSTSDSDSKDEEYKDDH